MENVVERRAEQSASSVTKGPLKTQQVVRQGVLLQSCVGTLSAVEYLKANGVQGSVIGRVLSGGEVRADDRASRDIPRAWD
ncbi:hypothetical protein [Telluria aromaticivorans]|uniref:Uncharacterized protein n=1 Tax=Telluria aromaticivorans TaxID=2725995 RepID=A0A7Y2JXD4_9BURK|nr:hypothetical protein [Telluria aromaticivorans]NNG22448.1 hypothetical protein [Telluria aromaticivorans]